jgi:hypothetical protein
MKPALLETLQRAWKVPVDLVWTENASVYLSVRRRKRTAAWVVRLHRSFESASPSVWRALERFLLSGRRTHLGTLRSFFQSHGRPRRARRLRRSAPRAEGSTHNLSAILAEVRGGAPFEGLPPVEISWGRRVRPGSRSIRLGSYCARNEPGLPSLIRVHHLLDDARVPAFAVGQVVHHELLHHHLTALFGAMQGRRHGPEFRQLERLFPAYEAAAEWQRVHLRHLLCGEGAAL